jgi:hypothetical protein
MKMSILTWLSKNNISYEIGQVKGQFECITLEYKKRAEFIEYLKKKNIKVRDIIYSEDMKHVTIVFVKESRL